MILVQLVSPPLCIPGNHDGHHSRGAVSFRQEIPQIPKVPAAVLPLEQGSIGSDDPIGPTAPLTSCYPSWWHLHSSTSGRQGSAAWADWRHLCQNRPSDLTRRDAVPFRNRWNGANVLPVSRKLQSRLLCHLSRNVCPDRYGSIDRILGHHVRRHPTNKIYCFPYNGMIWNFRSGL